MYMYWFAYTCVIVYMYVYMDEKRNNNDLTQVDQNLIKSVVCMRYGLYGIFPPLIGTSKRTG